MKKTTVDAMGQACPRPVILAKQALDALATGTVEVRVDNEGSAKNLEKLAGNMGFPSESTRDGDAFVISIEKTGPGQEVDEADLVCDLPEESANGGKRLVIGIGSDRMGSGSDELGAVLMKSFLYTVSQTEPRPEAILFFNGGVHLTCEGSEALEDLRALEAAGTAIQSCGMCLDYYTLREKLAVGEVSNMYAIYERLAGADRRLVL